MKLTKKITNISAGCLLLIMFLLGIFSAMGDSLTMDESAHAPAGYSYITQQDMRLNPEHPPLLKDLAGLSVLLDATVTGTEITFPNNAESWQNKINGQWQFGNKWLFQSQNPTDKIIFWSRLPMMFIMLILGLYIFRWTRELYGNRAGLLALFLYSFSPAFLAHGHLVATDVGAAAAFFIATYYLVKWLKNQNKKNLIKAGLVFGLAMLTKFSLALLIPFFILLTLSWTAFLAKKNKPSSGYFFKDRQSWFNLFKPLIGLFLIGIIGMALVWPVYQFHTLNYPPAKQAHDTEQILNSFGNRTLADPVVWASDKPIIRSYAHYFLGLLMVTQRASGGNTAYFLGEVSSKSWPHYFPTVFAIKTPIALLILMVIAIYCAIAQRRRNYNNFLSYFSEFALILFFIIYWIVTLRSNLNIGIRHILPTFPVIYVLISGQIIKWLKLSILPNLGKENLKKITTAIIGNLLKTYLKYVILIILLLWYAIGTLNSYPHFLSYFNELVGGSENGYKYVTDSNLDWGQDLKRLEQFVDKNNIQTIYVDYFGGDSPEYRLGDKFKPWWGSRNPKEMPQDSWLAVSATFLQSGRGKPVHGFDQNTSYYKWLNKEKLVTTIGNSIFVYHIE